MLMLFPPPTSQLKYQPFPAVFNVHILNVDSHSFLQEFSHLQGEPRFCDGRAALLIKIR
jgi:hypothetical protein